MKKKILISSVLFVLFLTSAVSAIDNNAKLQCNNGESYEPGSYPTVDCVVDENVERACGAYSFKTFKLESGSEIHISNKCDTDVFSVAAQTVQWYGGLTAENSGSKLYLTSMGSGNVLVFDLWNNDVEGDDDVAVVDLQSEGGISIHASTAGKDYENMVLDADAANYITYAGDLKLSKFDLTANNYINLNEGYLDASSNDNKMKALWIYDAPQTELKDRAQFMTLTCCYSCRESSFPSGVTHTSSGCSCSSAYDDSQCSSLSSYCSSGKVCTATDSGGCSCQDRPVVCGDSYCDTPDENYAICPQDCTYSGDGVCNVGTPYCSGAVDGYEPVGMTNYNCRKIYYSELSEDLAHDYWDAILSPPFDDATLVSTKYSAADCGYCGDGVCGTPNGEPYVITFFDDNDGTEFRTVSPELVENADNCPQDCLLSEDCSNGADDDGDSLVDCDDPDCVGNPACPELGASCEVVIDPLYSSSPDSYSATVTYSIQTDDLNNVVEVFCNGEAPATPALGVVSGMSKTHVCNFPETGNGRTNVATVYVYTTPGYSTEDPIATCRAISMQYGGDGIGSGYDLEPEETIIFLNGYLETPEGPLGDADIRVTITSETGTGSLDWEKTFSIDASAFGLVNQRLEGDDDDGDPLDMIPFEKYRVLVEVDDGINSGSFELYYTR